MTSNPAAAQDQAIEEEPLDPDRPIIDAHHHLWEFRPAPEGMLIPSRFLLHDFVEMLEASGHNVTHSVFVECHAMYRADGPPELVHLGETEFVNGMAAMSASGNYGPCRVAARIVGTADISLGGGIAPVLEAHVRACGERFRGIRINTAYSEAGMFGLECDPRARGLMRDPVYHAGLRVLQDMDLSLDVWCFHSQLDELIDLATTFPKLPIILDHIGTPERMGRYAGREDEARTEWERSIRELARRPNVSLKLGGLGMDPTQPLGSKPPSAPSSILAEKWRPYIETCIEAFAPQRCMFESNFPPDNTAASYGAFWNAFKILARPYSDEEQDFLFRRTAAAAYRIPITEG